MDAKVADGGSSVPTEDEAGVADPMCALPGKLKLNKLSWPRASALSMSRIGLGSEGICGGDGD